MANKNVPVEKELRSTMVKLSLVVLNEGKSFGQIIPVPVAQFVIGRDPQCNLRPTSAVISKRHCALVVKDEKVSVQDFGSTNGTFVNEVPVKGSATLTNDAVLKVGPLLFKVVIEQTAPAPKASEPKPARAKVAAARTAKATELDGSDDDSVAHMLLAIADDDAAEDAPSGTTVLENNPKSPPPTDEMQTPVMTPAPKKEPEKKNSMAQDTANSAAAILAKYSRRNRGG